MSGRRDRHRGARRRRHRASRGIGAASCSLGDIGATVYVTGRTVRRHEAVDDAPGTRRRDRGPRDRARRTRHRRPLRPHRLRRHRGARWRASPTTATAASTCSSTTRGAATRATTTRRSRRRSGSRTSQSKWNGMFVGRRARRRWRRRTPRSRCCSTSAAVSSSTSRPWDRGRYLGALMYDTAKAAIVRATATLAHELRPHGVSVVAVFPGFTTTERVQMAGATGLESPEYTGRCVAALAADPDVAPTLRRRLPRRRAGPRLRRHRHRRHAARAVRPPRRTDPHPPRAVRIGPSTTRYGSR